MAQQTHNRTTPLPTPPPQGGREQTELAARSNSNSQEARRTTPAQATNVDPIVLQIVEGTLNSIEAEIEYAIERTARSPMIREAHDYRVGLFDRHCRKLTGRSYSAMPNAVVRDFPPADHAAGRRVPDERHLSHRGQHRPPARPVQHGAGVPRRRGGRLYPGLRPPRRHRRPRAGLDAGHRHHRVRGRPGGAADQALRRRPCATTRCSPSSSATPACPRCSPPISTARCRPA